MRFIITIPILALLAVNVLAQPASACAGCDQCLAPLDADSEMDPNPVDEINASFRFDYKIESVVNFHMDMSDVNVEYFRGDPGEFIMDYYVNSADGSILFPGGPTGFFRTNLTNSRGIGKVDAAIWLANGQMVIYGYDDNNVKRAVTRQSARSADDRFTSDYLNMMQFFSSSEELAEHPGPMPAHVDWDNVTVGYKGKLIDDSGNENTWTLYFDTAPTPIKTSCIMMGYMVGVLKDVREMECNRLLVYNKVSIGDEDSDGAIEAVLRSVRPMGITFDGSGYKPLRMGGEAGTDIQARLRNITGQLVDVARRMETVEESKKRCPSDLCREIKDREIAELQAEEDQLNCQMARAMGMEDMMEECN